MARLLKEQKKKLVFAGLLVAQLILISLQMPLGRESSYFQRAVFFLFAPVQKAVHGLVRAGTGFWGRYVYLRLVETQNQRFRDELFHLRQENTLLRNELERAVAKRDMERLLADLGQSYLVAEVIGADAVGPAKSIVINRGSRHGLKSNMAVVDKWGNLVGRVTGPVSAGEAVVQLVTDDNSAVGVFTETNRVSGVLAGNARSGTCWLKYIQASDDRVLEGDELVTSGFDKIYPAGLKVGRITSVALDGSLLKKIAVKPYLDFSQLSIVAVLIRTPGESFGERTK
jgi:rod shape-determining protein MreC